MNVNKAIKSIIIIIVFAFGSKALGFVREALIASKFGSGEVTDSFFIALTATSLFTSLITQAIKTTTIPVLAEIESTEGEKGKVVHINNLLHILMILSVALMLLGWILTPITTRLLAIGFDAEQYQLTVKLTRIGIPVLVFSSIVGVFRAFLQSSLMFTESATTQLPFNFTYILFLIFFSDRFGIIGLMVISVLAVASQIIFQIPGLKKAGYKYKMVFNPKDEYIFKIVKLIPPVLISVAINDINKIVDRSLGSTLIKGSVSALHYANRIQVLIVELFISVVGTVVFPVLSKEVNNSNQHNLKKTILHSINSIMLITIPATMFIIIFSEPIVKIAFQRGEFDILATKMTSSAVIFYIIGLTPMSINFILQKIYYAFQDTKTPMINSFYSMIINVVFSIILVQFMQHSGLALGTTIAGILMMVLLMLGLKKKIINLEYSGYFKCLIKSLISSVAMIIVSLITYKYFIYNLNHLSYIEILSLGASLILGLIVYLIMIICLKLEEIEWLKSVIRARRKNNQKT